MQNENKEIYLFGDFNCDILVKVKKPITKQLLEVCKDALLEQVINGPTRITEHSKTALDLIFTSHAERVIQTGVLHFGISDHYMAFMVRKSHIPKLAPSEIWVRNIKCYDINTVQEEMANLPWEARDLLEDPNTKWEAFHSMFLEVADSNSPWLRKKVRGHDAPYMASEL